MLNQCILILSVTLSYFSFSKLIIAIYFSPRVYDTTQLNCFSFRLSFLFIISVWKSSLVLQFGKTFKNQDIEQIREMVLMSVHKRELSKGENICVGKIVCQVSILWKKNKASEKILFSLPLKILKNEMLLEERIRGRKG